MTALLPRFCERKLWKLYTCFFAFTLIFYEKPSLPQNLDVFFFSKEFPKEFLGILDRNLHSPYLHVMNYLDFISGEAIIIDNSSRKEAVKEEKKEEVKVKPAEELKEKPVEEPKVKPVEETQVNGVVEKAAERLTIEIPNGEGL